MQFNSGSCFKSVWPFFVSQAGRFFGWRILRYVGHMCSRFYCEAAMGGLVKMNYGKKTLWYRWCKVGTAVALLSTASVQFALPAFAEQLSVQDSSGDLRSAAVLSSGKSANIQVVLSGSAQDKLGSLEIKLLDTASSQVIQAVKTDDGGQALFEKVSAGSYKVTLDEAPSTVKLGSVKVIELNPARQDQTSKNEQRDLTRAVYVVGASALPVAVGLSLADSDSKKEGSAFAGQVDSNLTAEQSGLNAANQQGSNGSLVAPLGAGQVSALGSAAPDPGAPSPAPSAADTTVNTAPDEADPGSPSLDSSTPTAAPVPPDPIDPPAPSSS